MKTYEEKLEQVSRYCAKRIGKNLTETQIVAIINKLKTASPKVTMRFLTEKAMNVYNNNFSKEFQLMMNQIFQLNDGTYPNAKAIIEEIQKEKDLNLPEGENLEENHKTLKESLKIICDRFNELGIDYYIGGALAVYLRKGELIRYHDDIDFSVNEADLPKVALALKGTPFELKDNRLKSEKVSDKTGNVGGEHEILATRKDSKFHLGFFPFVRKKDDVIAREYYSVTDEQGNKTPYLFKRDKTSKEIFELEHTDEYIENFGTKFKCSSAESVCQMKEFTKREKDEKDVKQWREWGMIDNKKIEHVNRLRKQYTLKHGSLQESGKRSKEITQDSELYKLIIN